MPQPYTNDRPHILETFDPVKLAATDIQKRICIALPARGTEYQEPAAILTSIVQESGGQARLVRDGDPSILDADTLILFGKCSAFTRSAQRLAAHRTSRPATILWHIEPLPPAVLPSCALPTSRILAHCDWNLLPKPFSTLVRYIPGHNLIRDAARSALSARVKTLAGWNTERAWAHIHPRHWYHAIQHDLWLRNWHSHDWCDLVAASTLPRCDVLARMGIRCEYAPLGYHPAWAEDLGIERDIDVLFLGRVKRTSRQRPVKRLVRRLRDEGIRLMVVDRNCYGRDRSRLLSRTRIALDIVQNTWEMPILRLLISMTCGAMVISNWPADPFPFREDHFVRVPLDAFADTIQYYLGHEPERKQMAESARRYVTSDLAWHGVLARVLRRSREHFEARSGVVV